MVSKVEYSTSDIPPAPGEEHVSPMALPIDVITRLAIYMESSADLCALRATSSALKEKVEEDLSPLLRNKGIFCQPKGKHLSVVVTTEDQMRTLSTSISLFLTKIEDLVVVNPTQEKLEALLHALKRQKTPALKTLYIAYPTIETETTKELLRELSSQIGTGLRLFHPTMQVASGDSLFSHVDTHERDSIKTLTGLDIALCSKTAFQEEYKKLSSQAAEREYSASSLSVWHELIAHAGFLFSLLPLGAQTEILENYCKAVFWNIDQARRLEARERFTCTPFDPRFIASVMAGSPLLSSRTPILRHHTEGMQSG